MTALREVLAPIYLKLNRKQNIVGIISIVVSVCLSLFYFSQFTEQAFQNFFSSDSLYLPSIYKDLFIDGGSFKGWHVNPAPNFFPDMLFFFILMFFTQGNLIVSSFLFGIIQFYFILFVVYKIFKTFAPTITLNKFSLIILLFSLMPLFYIIDGESYNAFLAFSNAYHNGAFLMALISLWIVLNYLKNPRWSLIICFFIVATISIPCDKLYLMCFIVPAIICFCILLILNYKRKLILDLLLSSIIAAVAGLIIFYIFAHNPYFFTPQAQQFMCFDCIRDSWELFRMQMISYYSKFSITQFFFSISLLSFFFTALYTSRKTIRIITKKDICDVKYVYSLFSTIAVPIIIFTPIFAGNYSHIECLRYNIFGFLLSIFNVILPFYDKKQFNLVSNVSSVCFIIIIFFISLGVPNKIQNPYKGLKNFFTYYPEEAKELDELTKSLNVQYGVTNDYWKAKRITMFSKQNVRLYTVTDFRKPDPHVTNEYWYLGKETGEYSHPNFNFLYWKIRIDASHFSKNAKISRLQNKRYILIAVDPFSYKDINYNLH